MSRLFIRRFTKGNAKDFIGKLKSDDDSLIIPAVCCTAGFYIKRNRSPEVFGLRMRYDGGCVPSGLFVFIIVFVRSLISVSGRHITFVKIRRREVRIGWIETIGECAVRHSVRSAVWNAGDVR